LYARQRGVLDNMPPKLIQITDGTSNTFLITDDTARRENYLTNPSYVDPAVQLGIAVDQGSAFTLRRFWRWAEQDSGFGVSGDPLLNTKTTSFAIINNNPFSPGTDGPNGCWKTTNNCGPNDEIFSFHTGGAMVVFADGHVQFISNSITPVVGASLTSRSGGEVFDASSY
jgi:prepilin-type processing-associated H-X9-DG protein